MAIIYLLLYILFSGGQMILNKTYQMRVKMSPVSYMFYLIVMGSVAAVLFFLMSGCQLFGDQILYIYSLVACLAVIINTLISLLSLSHANLATVTVSQNAGNLVLPVVYGLVILNESINIYNIIGIVLIIISFLISFIGDYRKNNKQKQSLLAKFICLILFFTSGMISVIHKSFTVSGSLANNQTYLSWINIYMVPIIIITYLILKRKKRDRFIEYRNQIDFSNYLLVALGSTIGCLGMVCAMQAMTKMNISIYSALYSSMYIIFLVTASKFIFKETIKKNNYIAIIFAILSVIFTSSA